MWLRTGVGGTAICSSQDFGNEVGKFVRSSVLSRPYRDVQIKTYSTKLTIKYAHSFILLPAICLDFLTFFFFPLLELDQDCGFMAERYRTKTKV